MPAVPPLRGWDCYTHVGRVTEPVEFVKYGWLATTNVDPDGAERLPPLAPARPSKNDQTANVGAREALNRDFARRARHAALLRTFGPENLDPSVVRSNELLALRCGYTRDRVDARCIFIGNSFEIGRLQHALINPESARGFAAASSLVVAVAPEERAKFLGGFYNLRESVGESGSTGKLNELSYESKRIPEVNVDQAIRFV